MSGAIDAAHLEHQRAWSTATFGPPEVRGPRGPLAHARKELDEVAEDPSVLEEWVDVVILAFDGALRAGHEPQAIIDAVKAKQAKNERREWPDWRGVPVDQPIEHKRHLDPCPDAQQAAQAPVSRPNAAPVDSGANGRLNERQRAEIGWAVERDWQLRDQRDDWDGLHAVVERIVREHTDRALAEVEVEKDQVRADTLAVCAMLLGKVVNYWDGRPLSTGHGVHLYQDVIDVLRGIEGDRDHNLELVRAARQEQS